MQDAITTHKKESIHGETSNLMKKQIAELEQFILSQ